MIIRIAEKSDTYEINGSDAEIVAKITGTKVKDPSHPVLVFSRQTIPNSLSQLIAANYSIHFTSPSGAVTRKVLQFNW